MLVIGNCRILFMMNCILIPNIFLFDFSEKNMCRWEWILGKVRLIKNEISHKERLRTEKVYLFSHTMCYPTNPSNKYTEKITSSYLVLKAYINVLCRIIFNRSHNLLLPLHLDGAGTKIDIRIICYEELINLCKKICALSSSSCNPNFFIHIFDNYKKGIDFFSCTLEIRK